MSEPFIIRVPVRSRNKFLGTRTKKFMSDDPRKMEYLTTTVDVMREQGRSAREVENWFKDMGLLDEYRAITQGAKCGTIAAPSTKER